MSNAQPIEMYLTDIPEWFEAFHAQLTPRAFRLSPQQWCPYRYTGTIGRASGLLVICSGCVEADGKRWIHVSTSRRSRLPTYEDLVLVKNSFIGRDRLALQLFVPERQHVNFAKNCLHLWHCLDGDPTPDFRRLGMV